MDKKQGLLIVVDGTDGAGKTTQINLLEKYLKEKNIDFEIISFPRYGQNIYAEQVKKYLEGHFGSLKDVDPYKMSKAYAGDRLLAKPLIDKWLREGKLVIANRYVSSNKAHMGANIPKEKREDFFKWLGELEYKKNGLPKEDLTILLMVDAKLGQKNVQASHKVDLHEQNLKHLEEANKIYLALSKKEKNWVVINCMKNGKMKSKEDIHKDLIEILEKKFPT